MTGTSHQVFGVLFAGAVGIILGWPFVLNPTADKMVLLHFLAGVLFGAWLPDIDHPQSSVGRRFWPLSWLISKIFGHRGITHSAIGASLVLYGAYYLLNGHFVVWLGLALGYVSHLIGDMLTVSGCPLFWPLRIPVRFPVHVRTGTLGEIAILLLSAVVVAGICYSKINGYL